MSKSSISMYNGKVWGYEVSEYGLKNGYLDYQTLSEMIGPCFINNTIREATMGDWEMVSGTFDQVIMSDYIITKYGYEILKEYTDEVVFYNENLDVYVWAVDHYGTNWKYVLTDIELIEEEDL